jgi:hypothetical protein
MMQPTMALSRLAYYAGQVLGVRASYPAPGTVVPPHLILFWDESTLNESMGEQTWMLNVKGQLMTALKGNTPNEIAQADSLIGLLADAFTSDVDNHNAYHLQTDDGTDRVDYCRLERVVPSQMIGYAGHDYYGAELFFGIKLRRFAGS